MKFVGGALSSFGFSAEKIFFLSIARFAKTMRSYRGTRTPCKHQTLLLPDKFAARPRTFISRFLSSLGVFSNRGDIVRAARTTVGGSHFFRIQFKYRQECWPQENLDFATFLAMYFYIETDKHSFLGNDEVAARLLVGIYWSCLAASERVLVLKNGFYRLFHRYLCATDSQPAGQRETRMNGVRYGAFHDDCFQQPKMSALLPRGIGELFYGSMLMELYDGDIPRDGLIARMPIFNGNGADDRTDADALSNLIAN
ncbi:unnamed protein product [Oikopleura dioica]|uniref:Uncharacterized protein n=1 Tax=Oikopleura dioica TaxID=34765 RepID=E4X2G9_OIKDI|nr:unnamed protein product [Oikopleura dioica]